MSADLLALVAAMPMPEPDGSAEMNKVPHPEGGYTYDEVPAWSEALVRSERLKAAQLVLAQGEPVAWYDGAKFYGSQEAASMACADMGSLMPLYAGPAAPVNAEVLAALKEVLRISDRKHVAWDTVKAWVASAEAAAKVAA